MSIEITYDGGGYHVSVTPPHAPAWHSPRGLTPTEAMTELSKRGCHPTDVTDALTTANPEWFVEHDREVRRRRDEELRAILEDVASEERDTDR